MSHGLQPIEPHSPEFHALLHAAQLPSEDLVRGTPGRVLAGVDEHGLVVAGMVQTFPNETTWALLRSIVVRTDRRGSGLGRTLIAELEQWVRGQGVRRLVLQTTDAHRLFERLGYTPVATDGLPAAVLSHPQFTGLCPNATAMARSIPG